MIQEHFTEIHAIAGFFSNIEYETKTTEKDVFIKKYSKFGLQTTEHSIEYHTILSGNSTTATTTVIYIQQEMALSLYKNLHSSQSVRPSVQFKNKTYLKACRQLVRMRSFLAIEQHFLTESAFHQQFRFRPFRDALTEIQEKPPTW